MAHNNFTPIPFGSAANAGVVNAPLEQLSDAIDLVRTGARADDASITQELDSRTNAIQANLDQVAAALQDDIDAAEQDIADIQGDVSDLQSDVAAIQQTIEIGTILPMYAATDSGAADYPKMVTIDQDSITAKNTFAKGDPIVIRFANGNTAVNPTATFYWGSTVILAVRTLNNIPTDLTAGACVLFVYNGSHFDFVARLS